MRVLNAISFLVAASAALLTSARPAPGITPGDLSTGSLNTGDLTKIPGTIAGIVHGATGQSTDITGATGSSPLGIRSNLPSPNFDPKSLPSLIIDATHRVNVIAARINVAVIGVRVDADVRVVVTLVRDILDIVAGLIDRVKLLVGVELKTVLLLEGEVITIVRLAELIAILLYIIFSTLFLVLRVVAVVNYRILHPVLIQIGADLVILLDYVVRIAGDDVIVHIAAFLRPAAVVIRTLGYDKVLTVLHL